ncbi:MAG: cysteine desulfurase [Flavobacteriales bacterium]|nr:cysteine desulfurase [Flavobacteriales bacterium]|tara:strand:+ start:1746 stop:2879 length:1134 start_codon:yes stop_codon:yes gene_type:complete
MKRVYLDNAATTPISKEIIELMSSLMKHQFANPSSTHSEGRKSKTIVEESRTIIAKILNTYPRNIFFTSGGTESDNMAIKMSIENYNIKHAITSRISHHAVLYPLEKLAKENKIKLSYVKLDKNGLVSFSDLKNLLENNSRTFVSIMHANNEVGVIQDIKKIGLICQNYNAIFHSDTVQTIGHYHIDLQKINIDFLAASAHKFHGPKGIGFIYISDNVKISPFIIGGAQERNMRAGTENIHSISALAKAMQLAYENLDNDMIYIKKLKSYMIEKLKLYIPDVQFFSNSNDLDNSLYTVLTVSFPLTKNSEMLLFNLDIAGVSCSGGSACASGSNKGSHVLSYFDPNAKRTGIRFSFSKYNTFDDIDFTIQKLKNIFN